MIKSHVFRTLFAAPLLAVALLGVIPGASAQSCGSGEFACGSGCCPSNDHCATNTNAAACCSSDSPTYCKTPSGGVQCCTSVANGCDSNGNCVETTSGGGGGGGGGGAFAPGLLAILFPMALLLRRRKS